MTKYEWETELKKSIHRLPDEEIKRVLEYYGELFEDNVERGKSETQIINEFGNPVDVADKILSEYDGELVDEPETRKTDGIFEGHDDIRISNASPHAAISEESKAEENASEQREDKRNIEIVDSAKSEKKEKTQERSEPAGGAGLASSERVILFVILNVVTGFQFFIVAAVVWIVICVFTVAFAAVAVGGGCAAVISFGVMFNGFGGSGLAQLGMGLLCIGVGTVLTICAVKIIKLMAGLTRKCYVALKNWLLAKKEGNA